MRPTRCAHNHPEQRWCTRGGSGRTHACCLGLQLLVLWTRQHWMIGRVTIFNMRIVTVKSEHNRHLLSRLRVGNVNLSSSVVSTGLLWPWVADRHHDLLGNAAMAADRGPHPAWFGIHGIEDIVVLEHFLDREKWPHHFNYLILCFHLRIPSPRAMSMKTKLVWSRTLIS